MKLHDSAQEGASNAAPGVDDTMGESTTCMHCRYERPTEGKHCPHCGYPWPWLAV